MNQILDPFNKWFADLDEVEMVAIEQERLKKARQSIYLHCWCVGNADYDLMWKAHIKDPPGVAIKSSVKRLIKLCDDAMSLGDLIERVVLQPKAKKGSLKFVRKLLDKSNFQEIPIEFSRDDRELME